MSATLIHGDCLEVLRTLDSESVDSIVTDPPAGIAFMNKSWDHDKGGRDAWIAWLTEVMVEAHRVLKPGGHALVWALPRTSHWTATALEDAGFEIRDCVVHLFGSGFPKSLDVGKAIDRARDDRDAIHAVIDYLRGHVPNRPNWSAIDTACGCPNTRQKFFSRSTPGMSSRCPTWDQWLKLQGLLRFGPDMDAEVWRLNGRKGTPGDAWNQREVIGEYTQPRLDIAPGETEYREAVRLSITAPATPDAQRWDGWGTSLKPGAEHWWLVRKPFRGTVAANVIEHGTGALNIGACRVSTADRLSGSTVPNDIRGGKFASGHHANPGDITGYVQNTAGRWPANAVFTHSASCAEGQACQADCPVGELDGQSGTSASKSRVGMRTGKTLGTYGAFSGQEQVSMGHSDTGGASRFYPVFRYQAKAPSKERPKVDGIAHPTAKSLGLMRFLTKLVTPPGGTVLDPFAGSGATLEAAVLEGFHVIGIEREADYIPLIHARLARVTVPSEGVHIPQPRRSPEGLA